MDVYFTSLHFQSAWINVGGIIDAIRRMPEAEVSGSSGCGQ